jgi:hypothetical protein
MLRHICVRPERVPRRRAAQQRGRAAIQRLLQAPRHQAQATESGAGTQSGDATRHRVCVTRLAPRVSAVNCGAQDAQHGANGTTCGNCAAFVG